MFWSCTSYKRVAAVFAGAVLLLCQTVAAANACMIGGVRGGSDIAEEACHDAGNHAVHNACHKDCESPFGSYDHVKTNSPTLTGLQSLAVTSMRLGAVASFPVGFTDLSARIRPPPLPIVLNRLRN